jgi:hypothetical protein
MTAARDLTPPAQASQDLPPDNRIRLAAAIGVAGAALSFVGWALMLSNPASGTTLWYAGNAVGELAMAGTTVLVLGMLTARETGAGITGRSFLALWAFGQVLILVGGIQSLVVGNQDTILFPVGGITAGLASLVASIFIACNKRLKGSPRRWAPLIYTVGTFITGFFQGNEHTLKVNLADLTNNLLMLLLAGAFYAGARATESRGR